MNMTLFRLKISSYPLNYFGQGMAAATPCHMGSSATGFIQYPSMDMDDATCQHLSATSSCKGGSAAAYYACLSGFRFSPRDWARPVAKRKVTGGTGRPSSRRSLQRGSERNRSSRTREACFYKWLPPLIARARAEQRLTADA